MTFGGGEYFINFVVTRGIANYVASTVHYIFNMHLTSTKLFSVR